MPKLTAPNDEATARIGCAAGQMIESLTYYCDERDTLLHLADVHDQFKIIARELGYSVRPAELVS